MALTLERGPGCLGQKTPNVDVSGAAALLEGCLSPNGPWRVYGCEERRYRSQECGRRRCRTWDADSRQRWYGNDAMDAGGVEETRGGRACDTRTVKQAIEGSSKHQVSDNRSRTLQLHSRRERKKWWSFVRVAGDRVCCMLGFWELLWRCCCGGTRDLQGLHLFVLPALRAPPLLGQPRPPHHPGFYRHSPIRNATPPRCRRRVNTHRSTCQVANHRQVPKYR